ncbi:MAG: hypothetical protein Q4D65_03455, partial [Peptostreptococcaceae bacterium]|nr:hypothetical protein [Peptostreptococcaceae bacterium]
MRAAEGCFFVQKSDFCSLVILFILIPNTLQKNYSFSLPMERRNGGVTVPYKARNKEQLFKIQIV